MNVTVCSIFRDSAAYVGRYMMQMAALSYQIDLRLVLTYGDCSDDTGKFLEVGRDWGLRLEVERFDHGGPRYGSVDHPQRWDQIAKVVSATLDRVGDPGDALLWVESDLRWHTDSMVRLLASTPHVPAVAPMVFADSSNRFYDIWGYRKDGVKFEAYPPYWQGDPDPTTGLVKIDSCGSCWATAGDSWRDWSGHWPFTAGGGLWLDPTVKVRHP